MDDNIHLILLKSEKCGHCKSFMPIFKEFKNNKIYNCTVYDTEDEQKYTLFKNNYPDIDKNFDGAVPTIYIIVNGKFQEVKSSRVNGDGDEELNNAVNDFVNNINNSIKTLQSNNHTVYVQTAGNKNKEYYKNEEYYKKKYIKYKIKYLQKK